MPTNLAREQLPSFSRPAVLVPPSARRLPFNIAYVIVWSSTTFATFLECVRNVRYVRDSNKEHKRLPNRAHTILYKSLVRICSTLLPTAGLSTPHGLVLISGQPEVMFPAV